MSGKSKLTDKQKLFATLVGSAGLTLSEAYRQSYAASNMSAPSIRKEASTLAVHPNVSPLIEEYSKRRQAVSHSQALSQGLSDRDKVLTKLRHLADHGESQDQTKLRAVVELGRTCNVFSETTIIKSERTSEDILNQLQQKLDELMPTPADTDQSLH